MKKVIISVLLTVIFSLCGCQYIGELFNPKPVFIDGLGSLHSLENKHLNDKQLLKVIKTVNERNRVSEEDAQKMLYIFKENIEDFTLASQLAVKAKDVISSQDVISYLELILAFEQFREPIQKLISDESKRILIKRINLSEPEKNNGNIVGQFQQTYTTAYIEVVINDKENSNRLINDFEDITNANNQLLALQIIEQTSHEIINNSEINKEQRAIAQMFSEDIKTYNESLPADEKILDSNGRLIDTSSATATQKNTMLLLSQGSIENETNVEARKAGGRVGDIVRPMADAIEAKIKTSYIPK